MGWRHFSSYVPRHVNGVRELPRLLVGWKVFAKSRWWSAMWKSVMIADKKCFQLVLNVNPFLPAIDASCPLQRVLGNL